MTLEPPPYSISRLLRALDITHRKLGSRSQDSFHEFRALGDATEGGLSYCSSSHSDAVDAIGESNAHIVLADIRLAEEAIGTLAGLDKTIILCDRPKLQFVRMLESCVRSVSLTTDEPTIHPTSRIAASATIGRGTTIGPNCSIGRATIGEQCTIKDSVHILDGVRIGNRVRIDRFCVIGSEGFGYVADEVGNFVHFPQIGGVVIEDDVDIFPFCDIDRGTLGNTIVGAGVKINHHVHLAHNCVIGPNALIRSGVQICGSVTIGSHVAIGAGSVIRDNLTIGQRAIIGIGSVVVRDVGAGTTVFGCPASVIPRL